MPDFLSEYWRVFLGVAVTVLVMWRLSQKATTLNLFKRSESAHEWNNAPLLREVLPAFANELHDLLNQLGEVEPANQVAGLRLLIVVDAETTFAVRSTRRRSPEESTVQPIEM
jgi:hypothetical protein